MVIIYEQQLDAGNNLIYYISKKGIYSLFSLFLIINSELQCTNH